jgi:hypothetical protein
MSFRAAAAVQGGIGPYRRLRDKGPARARARVANDGIRSIQKSLSSLRSFPPQSQSQSELHLHIITQSLWSNIMHSVYEETQTPERRG